MMMRPHIYVCGLFCLMVLGCGPSASQHQGQRRNADARTDTCDSPDAPVDCCFANMPASLTPIMTIADVAEAGERLAISGKVYQADGKTPCPDIILYAYQTDHSGHYSKNGDETGFQKWHGRLHGWCKTDRWGRYEIRTIRPGRYPDLSMPSHIHCAIKGTKGDQSCYINDFVFSDDSLVTESYLSTLTLMGGTGIVDISREPNGTWTGHRDIILR